MWTQVLFYLLYGIALAAYLTWARLEHRRRKNIWISLALSIPPIAAAFTLFTICVQLFLTGIVLACSAGRERFLRLSPSIAFVLTVAFFGWLTGRHLIQIERVLQQNPLEDLSPRLAGVHRTSNGDEREINLSEDVSKRLTVREADVAEFNEVPFPFYWDATRTEVLRELHEEISFGFVMAQGFGLTRMRAIWRENGPTDPGPLHPLPQPSHEYEPPDPGTNLADGDLPGAPLEPNAQNQRQSEVRKALTLVHDFSLTDFLDVNRFGYQAPDGRVSGFVAHRFTEVPQSQERTMIGEHHHRVNRRDEQFVQKNFGSNWIVERIELISLLKHSPPVAYVTDTLPNMDELTNVPTRPLDPFEARSLEQLRTQEDITIDDRGHYIRMVGSLRASSDCLKCHEVPRGTLLGAFSYRLREAGFVRKAPVINQKPSL